MRRLFLKLLLLGLPFLAWLIVYLIQDPFCILRNYSEYDGRKAAHRDYLSTEILLAHSSREKYDSFILGNSRTLGFRSEDWAAYLPSGASVFSYGSDSDNLFGIAGKVDLIDSLGLPMRDVLLLLDNASVVGTEDSRVLFSRKHPRVSRGSALQFQVELAHAFFELHALSTLFQKPSTIEMCYAPVRNDILLIGPEARLRVDQSGYYQEKAAQFVASPEVAWGTVIKTEAQLRLLRKMAAIFRNHHTRLKVVIPPQFKAIRLNPKDVARMRQIFGPECVFDFSAASDINQDVRNWYDPHHFRPHVGRRLLREIYGGSGWLR